MDKKSSVSKLTTVRNGTDWKEKEFLLRGHLVFEEVELVKSYRGRNKFSRSLVPPLDIALVEYSHIFSEPPPILAFFDSSLQEFPFLFVAFGHEKYQQSSIRPKKWFDAKYFRRINFTLSFIQIHSFRKLKNIRNLLQFHEYPT